MKCCVNSRCANLQKSAVVEFSDRIAEQTSRVPLQGGISQVEGKTDQPHKGVFDEGPECPQRFDILRESNNFAFRNRSSLFISAEHPKTNKEPNIWWI